MAATKAEIFKLTRAEEKTLLEEMQQQHKLLNKSQRQYKKIVSLRLKTRYEQMLERSQIKTTQRLKSERKDLRADIFIADGRCHRDYDKICLTQIECHIQCQEHLSEQIKTLKTRISNMAQEKGRLDKQIYELNRRTVPDSMHQNFVMETRKRIALLENSLEVSVRRECIFKAANADLKQELKGLLNNRMYFHKAYTKLVQKLNADKKFMLDLIDYVSSTFNSAIEMQEKLTSVSNKLKKDDEIAKMEMQATMRTFAAADLAADFTNCKNQVRTLAKLQPSEFKRRVNFKRKHVHKITLYNTVLGKLYDFTNSYNIDAVIDQYQQQEGLYYSYFRLSNELSFHMTLVQNAADHLYDDVSKADKQNRLSLEGQKTQLIDLEAKIIEQRRRNQELRLKLVQRQNHLEAIFQAIAQVFNLCRGDAAPLMQMLGNQAHVNLYNVHAFLESLELRILNIVRGVYIKERKRAAEEAEDEDQIVERIPTQYTVKELLRAKEYPTQLNDIVLTQQCPECAEGETINMNEGDAVVLDIDETRKELFEKVNQPDMQYRLHSVSQCRLPRSRVLAAKRND